MEQAKCGLLADLDILKLGKARHCQQRAKVRWHMVGNNETIFTLLVGGELLQEPWAVHSTPTTHFSGQIGIPSVPSTCIGIPMFLVFTMSL